MNTNDDLANTYVYILHIQNMGPKAMVTATDKVETIRNYLAGLDL